MPRLLDPDAIDLHFAPRLRDHVTLVPIEDEALLYEEGGSLHQLNSTAAAVCTLFDGEVPLAHLVGDLAAVFDGDSATIAQEVLAMTRELGRKGLLEGIRHDDPDAADDVGTTDHAGDAADA